MMRPPKARYYASTTTTKEGAQNLAIRQAQFHFHGINSITVCLGYNAHVILVKGPNLFGPICYYITW